MESPFSHNKQSKKDSGVGLAKYAGIGTQMIAGLLMTLYIGKKIDAYFLWYNKLALIFPSLFIIVTLVMVVKDTQKKK
ncbi:MAG: hypothetical protein NTY43_04435 [Bacteroidetes bacterium]|jgi:uncharacterized membrane protein|nr:hypothetical protein [Bacteroidota bacterium]